ncbi:MAG: PstS family phosphate ABC transporter substrate-binding protein [Spirochaetes bacterium]|nr:PstS family phosphate ABC transporter substrate-binding protein [Spirochaetota bacterium]
MKKTCLLIVIVLMLILTCKKTQKNDLMKGQIAISGAWALYPMVVKWSEEFKKIHPQVNIDISAGGAGKGMSDTLKNIVDLGMVSRSIYDEEIKRGALPFAVCKDSVVPVINIKNPLIEKIRSKGANKELFKKIYIDQSIKNWEELISGNGNTDIHLYTRSDSCGAAETWANYMGYKQEDLKGTGIYSDPGLVEAVKNDIFGLGYNNINYIYDNKTKLLHEGIAILPLDINNNSKIDKDENFYSNLNELTKAIADDIYPSPPARELYLVSNGKLEKKAVIEFIKWILTNGQLFVEESGYIKLSNENIKNQLDKLQ